MSTDPSTPRPLRRVELRRIELPLVTPFRTSFGATRVRDALLIRVELGEGSQVVEGWGECVAMAEPTYSSEYADGAHAVIADHLLPRLFARGALSAADVAPALAPISGHPMAKAALEMALLDAELRSGDTSFAELLGVAVDRIPSGVSVGIFETLDELLDAVQRYVDDGYARIKLKIEPGWDIEPVRQVRALVGPSMPLQVDANTAYARVDGEHLARLDEFDLLLIEQPLPEDDLLGHARLAAEIATPICLDESLTNLAVTADAIELGGCEVANLKPGRVGGYLEAVRIHDHCRSKGIPVWCGGMLETGIGRAANAVLAGLPGFTLPGDISASTRFYESDIVVDPITVEDGHITVPRAPGLGFEIDHGALAAVTTATHQIDHRS